MPLTITRLAPEDLSSTEVNKSLTTDRVSASYKLEYFDVSSVGAVPRDILSFGDAQWEDLVLTNWPAEIKSPSGLFPVLYIKTADGREIRLVESFVIEHYLAKQFGLLGDNEWEELQIKTFHSSSLYLRERLTMRVTWNYKEVQEKALESFLKKDLPLWIETHTKHLKDNGSNGHYVGNKTSLADLQTANVIDHFKCLYKGDVIVQQIQQGSPEIWKVKETVDNEPRLQKWRQSDEYKTHIAFSQARYANTGI
ncbi:Glutathione S-transferase S1 [Mortierella sp. AD032]|nr:Glutathione S-transferase S1 [Mortierella sp. AD032]